MPHQSISTQTDPLQFKAVSIQTHSDPHSILEHSVSDVTTLSHKFAEHCRNTLQLDVPIDFLTYTAAAMVRLKRTNNQMLFTT